jgi:hypothetical protein
MLDSMSVALPLTLAAVFVASGIAKLRRPDDVQGWTELGVPASLRRAWLVRLHPWGELALGAALALLGGMLGLLAALVSVVLMAAYLWLVARARRQTPDASCSCFGERRRITVVTVVRNAWLTALAVAAAAVIWMTPLFGGAALIGLADLGWLAALAIAAVTVGVILWPEGGENAPGTTPVVEPVTVASVEELDYVRTRTPAVPVTLADGSTINLRELAARRPLLLLAVSETCGSCTPVIDSTSKWRGLLPEVDVRFLVMLTRRSANSPRWLSRSHCTTRTATSVARSRIGPRRRQFSSVRTAGSRAGRFLARMPSRSSSKTSAPLSMRPPRP